MKTNTRPASGFYKSGKSYFRRADGKSEIAEALKAIGSEITEEEVVEKVTALVDAKYPED